MKFPERDSFEFFSDNVGFYVRFFLSNQLPPPLGGSTEIDKRAGEGKVVLEAVGFAPREGTDFIHGHPRYTDTYWKIGVDGEPVAIVLDYSEFQAYMKRTSGLAEDVQLVVSWLNEKTKPLLAAEWIETRSWFAKRQTVS